MSHHNNHSGATSSIDPNEDHAIVAIWLKKDPVRWVAGAMAGLVAGAAMMAFAVLLSKITGAPDILYPLKVPALPLLGLEATEMASMKGAIVGFAAHEILCIFLGFIYAHFTGTNRFYPLLGVGLTWGAFGFVFISALFSQSFRAIFVQGLPLGMVFFCWMVFGVALTSVSFFDRALRGGTR